jgi:hypothetical protein
LQKGRSRGGTATGQTQSNAAVAAGDDDLSCEIGSYLRCHSPTLTKALTADLTAATAGKFLNVLLGGVFIGPLTDDVEDWTQSKTRGGGGISNLAVILGAAQNSLALQFGQPGIEQTVRQAGDLLANLTESKGLLAHNFEDRSCPAAADQFDRMLKVRTVATVLGGLIFRRGVFGGERHRIQE